MPFKTEATYIGRLPEERFKMSIFFQDCQVESYRPVIIDNRTEATMAWFGGAAPKGVSPLRDEDDFRFLFTIPLTDERCVSVFHRCEGNFFTSMLKYRYRIQDESSNFVQFVTHGILSEGTQWADTMNRAAIILKDKPQAEWDYIEEDDDWFDSDVYIDLSLDQIYDGCKNGGLPSFYQIEGECLDSLALLRDGFRQCLQLAVPFEPEASWSGNWPFGGYYGHLLCRRSEPNDNAPFEFRWLVG
jgi:hypothetical protein